MPRRNEKRDLFDTFDAFEGGGGDDDDWSIDSFSDDNTNTGKPKQKRASKSKDSKKKVPKSFFSRTKQERSWDSPDVKKKTPKATKGNRDAQRRMRQEEAPASSLHHLEARVNQMERKHKKRMIQKKEKSGIFSNLFSRKTAAPKKKEMSRDEAALRIQSIQRGRRGRQEFLEKKGRDRAKQDAQQRREQAKRNRIERERAAKARNEEYDRRQKNRSLRKNKSEETLRKTKLQHKQNMEHRKKQNEKRALRQKQKASYRSSQYAYLSALFEEFDTSGDGWISPSELYALCSRFVANVAEDAELPSSEDEMMWVMRQITKSNLACINEAQFSSWVSGLMTLSAQQIQSTSRLSPIHRKSMNLAKACLDGLDAIADRELGSNAEQNGRTFQRQIYRPQQYGGQLNSGKKVTQEEINSRIQRIEEDRSMKERRREYERERAANHRREQNAREQRSIKAAQREKRRRAGKNAERARAIAMYRQEQHRLDGVQTDELKQKIMNARYYGTTVESSARQTLAGSSYSHTAPRKITRCLHEYYPTQGDYRSTNEFEENIVHWMFQQPKSSAPVWQGGRQRADPEPEEKTQGDGDPLASSGDWQSWNDSDAGASPAGNVGRGWSSSLMQQGSSLMQQQPSGALQESRVHKDVQALFHHYSSKSRYIDRGAFLTFINALQLPYDRSNLRRFASKTFAAVKSTHKNILNFSEFLNALMLICKTMYSSEGSVVDGFERLHEKHMLPLQKKVGSMGTLAISPVKKSQTVRVPGLRRKPKLNAKKPAPIDTPSNFNFVETKAEGGSSPQATVHPPRGTEKRWGNSTSPKQKQIRQQEPGHTHSPYNRNLGNLGRGSHHSTIGISSGYYYNSRTEGAGQKK